MKRTLAPDPIEDLGEELKEPVDVRDLANLRGVDVGRLVALLAKDAQGYQKVS